MAATPPLLTLSLRNFGPIAEADIEVRPLTILMGPNGSGKSTVCKALFSLFDAMPEFSTLDVQVKMAFQLASSSNVTPETRAYSELLSLLDGIKKSSTNRGLPFQSLPAVFRRLYVEAVQADIDRILTEIEKNISENFSAPFGEIVRGGPKQDACLKFRLERVAHSEFCFETRDGGRRNQSRPMREEIREPEARLHFDPREAEGVVTLDDLPYLEFCFFPLGENCFYLPAERSGLLLLEENLHAALVRAMSRRDGRAAAPRSGVVTSLFRDLAVAREEIDEGVDESLRGAMEVLERDVARGSIALQKPTQPQGYVSIGFTPADGSAVMELDRASTAIAELAPLVLLLRHLVEPGNFLIIEEPEAQLHPSAQVAMARVLARLVNAGVRVVITTHSDFLVSQLSNLVRLKDRPKLTEALCVAAEEVIRSEDVACYVMKLCPNGFVAENRPVTTADGIATSEFGDVAMGIYNESVEIDDGAPAADA